MPEPDGIGGAERAAILLLALGEDSAAEVLRHLGPREVQRVGATMAALRDVSAEQVRLVLEQFLESVGRHSSLGVDSERYLRATLTRALGEERASGVIDRILLAGSAEGLEALKWMEPRAVAEMVRHEHPQIIAIILAYLEPEQSAGVLAGLPDRTRVDVLMRVATLDAVQPAALAELNRILESQMAGSPSVQYASVGGTRTAAAILNCVDPSLEAELFESVREIDTDLGQQIQELMFVFEDLGELDDAAIRTLLREVSSHSVLIALKGSDEHVKERFFANMSRRAAEILRDDLESKGPVRVSEVEAAQREIVGIARRLCDEGRITLAGKGGDEYI